MASAPITPWQIDGETMETVKVSGYSVVSNSLWLHGLYSPWNSPGQSTGVGSLSLFQGIFPIQGSNPDLPLCKWILCQLSHNRSPRILEWVACPSSSGSAWCRNRTRVSYIAGRFFINWVIREAKQWEVLFFWTPKSLQMVTAAVKLKDACFLEEKLWPT